MTLAINVDSARIADRIWNDDTVRASIVAQASAVVDGASGTSTTGGTTGSTDSGGTSTAANQASLVASCGDEDANGDAGTNAATALPESEEPSAATASGSGAQQAVRCLDSLQLPLGWNSDADRNYGELSGWFKSLPGWVITMFAISLGAPFWFDALGRLARLRTTGAKPDPSSETKP